MTGDEQLIEAIVVAWTMWNAAPGNEFRARELEAAVRSLAGNHTTSLRHHVGAELRELGGGTCGRDIRTAIHNWLDREATHAVS